MSDNIYDYTQQAQKHFKHPVCRVAYTINNIQPVACTIIGEQPLFYMDYEEGYDEDYIDPTLIDDSYADNEFDASVFNGEDYFSEEDLNLLKEEILSLKSQINRIEKLSSSYAETDEQYMEKLFANVSSYTSADQTHEKHNLDSYLEILSHSRLAKEYITFANQNNVEIRFSSYTQTAEYSKKESTILLNPNQDEADILLELTAKLRRHWQHQQGVLINPLMFHPDQAILINRAQNADIMTSMVRVAWELQLAGQKQVWERLENSPMADLAHAFAREAYMDFRTINNGEASAAVFEAWFLSERCRSQDKALIQNMLADDRGYVFNMSELSKNITPDLIAALGHMPYGKNYLSSHVDTIMTDPIFTDVRDRSNANFLWFIKFERTFKETEQELQQGETKIASHPNDDAQKQKSSNGTNSNEQTAELLSFPGYEAGATPAAEAGTKPSKRLSGKQDTSERSSADIIYLRAWPAEPV